MQYHCPGVPVILVGSKIDLREDREAIERLKGKRLQPISHAEVQIHELKFTVLAQTYENF